MKHISIKAIIIACAIPIACAGAEIPDDNDTSLDLWAKASLSTIYLLNTHLNPFKIDVDVNSGIATLKGNVESSVEKELAEELAQEVNNILEVDNQLIIDSHMATNESIKKPAEQISYHISDPGITAKVRATLLYDCNETIYSHPNLSR